MKLHFEPNLDYQQAAIEAVCDLFKGQETCRTEFTVTAAPAAGQQALGFVQTELGVGNRLALLDEELLQNLHGVQLRHGLRPSEKLASGDFTVEMETGTGKTYVYLRTAFELNRRFGFTKFVIVVPVAIKEGVFKTLQITADHFRAIYGGVPFDYFIYDSGKLGQVRNFATSPNIQVMVMTVGAINKFGDDAEAARLAATDRPNVNVMYRPSEKTGGERPIDLIRATRPVVIIDEPQSVDGGLNGQGKRAIDMLSPLCTLRYSATHANKHHMVYRLDAVDAYERKLVKQIEVAALEVEGDHNTAYVKLLATRSKSGRVEAQIEVDEQMLTHVARNTHWVMSGDDLQQLTRRAVYTDFSIGEIRHGRGEQLMELRRPNNEEQWMEPGQIVGGVDPTDVKRRMIRRTIQEHLDKEQRLGPKGIKVLSLFFIDSVHKYRSYAADGTPQKGEYARIFEEEYRRLAKDPKYRTLFQEVDLTAEAEAVHNGYFSMDKKGGWSDTAENNQSGRDNAERAYNLIMRDKEELLKFSTKLKFIFSHSALREGWDNPNIFQICALRDIGTERERRQTIGRGLRLSVNQQGERVRTDGVNTLTVIATEGYEEFAENLQKEIEADTGIRFGIVEEHQFAAIPVADPTTGEIKTLGITQSKALWQWLRSQDYVDSKGRVQDKLRTALKERTLVLPAEFEAQQEPVTELLRKLAGKLDIKNANDRKAVRVNKEVLLSPEFQALWARIRQRTTYRVDFDNDKLIKDSVLAVEEMPPVARAQARFRTADIVIGRGGVEATEKKGKNAKELPSALQESHGELPDILTELQDRTQLTRRSLVHILTESKRLTDFQRNPQQFIDQVSELLNRTKRMALVAGIRYERLGPEHYYAQELFEEQELSGYLKQMVPATKSVYEEVLFDSSGVERSFAEELEANAAVKVFAKLPGWFQVPTPLGNYNPDWAVLIEKESTERLYFVVETKGSLFHEDLRGTEGAKIDCGKVHFRTLAAGVEEPAKYITASSFEDVLKHVI
jgi:type III restriction enzyme